jgi:hypothetical protein
MIRAMDAMLAAADICRQRAAGITAAECQLQRDLRWHQAARTKNRPAKIWHSHRSPPPSWVQVWVGFVRIPANVLPFFLLDCWSGRAGAVTALFVVITNVHIMWAATGMSRAMSMPHLLAWIPLEIALVLRAFGATGSLPPSSTEMALAIVWLIDSGISLVFDAIDSGR